MLSIIYTATAIMLDWTDYLFLAPLYLSAAALVYIAHKLHQLTRK